MGKTIILPGLCSVLLFSLPLLSGLRGGGAESSAKPAQSSLGQWLDVVLKAESVKLRPVVDWQKAVSVTMDLQILSVLDVDEKNEQLALYARYTQRWRDERLSWEPSRYGGVAKVTVPATMIWVPDLILYEMASFEEDDRPSLALVTHDGWVMQTQPRLLKSSCPLNLFHFPLDKHTCNLTFTSQSHAEHVQVLWEWNGRERDGLFSRGEWELLSLTASPVPPPPLLLLSGPALRLQVSVRRCPLLYVVTLLLPSALMLLLGLLALLIPVYLKQRLEVMATIYTGHFIFIIAIFTLFPPFNAEVPLIEIYLFGSLGLLALSAMETTILFQLANGRNGWAQRHIFPSLWQLRGQSPWEEHTTKTGDSTHFCTTWTAEPRGALLRDLTQIRQSLELIGQERHSLNMCRKLSATLDRAYIYLHCFVILTGGAVLLTQWSKGGPDNSYAD